VKPDPAFGKPRGNAPATRLTATLTDGITVSPPDRQHAGLPGMRSTAPDMEHKFRSNTAAAGQPRRPTRS